MKKGIVYITIAQIWYLIFNVINNFLLPKYLSVESYAVIKTFSLYLTFAGFLHFGFNDGVYLKYGGKDLKNIDSRMIAKEVCSFWWLELPISLVIFVIGIVINSPMWLCFSLGMLGFNLISFLKYFYQAIASFGLYSFAVGIENLLIVALNAFFLFVEKEDSPWYYIYIKIGVSLIISIALLRILYQKKSIKVKEKGSISVITANIRAGFVLMLGNFSSGIFTGLDRFFVKYFFSFSAFAIYSFAVSIEAVVNACISPLTVSLYNYFCKVGNESVEKVKRIKSLVIIWGGFAIAVAFPAKLIVEVYLKDYRDSVDIIFLLFGTQLAYMVIKGIYVNIYKARNDLNRYFIQMIVMIIIAIILNAVAYLLFKSSTSIAVATLFTGFIWLFICEWGDKDLRYNINEIMCLLGILVSYLMIGHYVNTIIGCLLYLLALFSFVYFFMRKTFFDFWGIVYSIVLQICKKIDVLCHIN